MKPRDTLARLRRFQVDETRRRIGQLEAMIAEFGRMAKELDREIANEEQRAGISDVSHFAYPTYARAARARRDNLQRSAGSWRASLRKPAVSLRKCCAAPQAGAQTKGAIRPSLRVSEPLCLAALRGRRPLPCELPPSAALDGDSFCGHCLA